MNRTAPVPVTCLCFFLWIACAAWGQDHPPIESLRDLRFEAANFADVRHREIRAWRSLPDTPSFVTHSTQILSFHARATDRGWPARSSAVFRRSLTQAAFPQGSFIQEKPSLFLRKYLYPSLLKQDLQYRPSTGDSLVGRASYAASRVFITRDGSGKGRLNTPYFLGLLASIAAHSAYRQSRGRSTLATFSSFGSTVGSDAGVSVFHEFGPGIRQIVKDHTPRFVSRIEERFGAK